MVNVYVNYVYIIRLNPPQNVYCCGLLMSKNPDFEKATLQSVTKGSENDREVIIKEGLLNGVQILLETDPKG